MPPAEPSPEGKLRIKSKTFAAREGNLSFMRVSLCKTLIGETLCQNYY